MDDREKYGTSYMVGMEEKRMMINGTSNGRFSVLKTCYCFRFKINCSKIVFEQKHVIILAELINVKMLFLKTRSAF